MKKGLTFSVAAVLAIVLLAPGAARANSPEASDTHAVHYYVSLGDSLAASFQPKGDLTHGYAEQLYAKLKASDPTLKLVKLGCGGESTYSFRFGSVSLRQGIGFSCGPPDFYSHTYPHKTQLDDAVSFLHAHRHYVSLVTITLGANDAGRLAPDGTSTSCIIDPALPNCAGFEDQVTSNLAVILGDLRAAAGLEVPIVGMTYYDVFAPLWFGAPAYAQQISDRVDFFNGKLAASYTHAGDGVADVAGAFHNGEFPLSAVLVCRWTWFCSARDTHAITDGYGVIAEAFADALP